MSAVFDAFQPDYFISNGNPIYTEQWDLDYLYRYKKRTSGFKIAVQPGPLHPSIAAVREWALDVYIIPRPVWHVKAFMWRWERDAVPILCLPYGCNRLAEPPKPKPRLVCDVGYAGNRNAPDKKDRINRMIASLRDRGFSCRLHGTGWEDGWLPAEDLEPLYASARVCVNVNQPGLVSGGHHVCERVFHVPGCGGILVTDDVRCTHDYFSEETGVFIVKDRDFLPTVRYVVNRVKEDPEWEADMRRRAFQHTQAHHTWAHRAERLLRFFQGGREFRIEDYTE